VSASRELLQLGLGKGKGKGAVPVQPLSIVSNAAYVQPTLLPMSNEPVYQPAAVLPLDQIVRPALAASRRRHLSDDPTASAASAAAAAAVAAAAAAF
jgi:hypothetical protein